MKMNTKRALAILLTVSMMVAVFAGCASSGTPAGSTSSSAGSSSAAAAPAVSTEYPMDVEELGSGTVKWAETDTADGWTEVTNEGGPTLGYTKSSGVALVQLDGFAFKDLNRNGKLDGYEDWRLDADSRARDLAAQLSAEELSGMMSHSSSFSASDDAADNLAHLDEGIRSILGFGTAFPVETQAKWNNSMQAYTEAKPFGIPVNISTNPRTTPVWPDNLALAATFDPELVFEVSKGLSKEYRALGIGTLLGPQIDLASEPRWSRIAGTFGEDPALSRDMTNASVSGNQSTYDESGNDLGWGSDSVNAMIKHWPGDGPGESGRESHDWFGQFTVYPGNQYDTHMIPFVDGGLVPDSKTGMAGGVMTSYSIAWSEDESYGELVGSAFSEYKIDMLREYGFDGVICTDWGVTSLVADGGMMDTGWGVQELSAAERIYKAIMAGADQIGDVYVSAANIIGAYNMGVAEHGEEFMLDRYRESVRRILVSFLTVGLFENPYVSISNAKALVGGAEATAEGYQAQLKSIVMLKNDDNAIKAAGSEKPTVYIPLVYAPAAQSFFGSTPSSANLPVDIALASEHFNVVTDSVSETLTGPAGEDGIPSIGPNDIVRATKAELANCDFALVFAQNPQNMAAGFVGGGYDPETDSIIPLSLQYSPYVANSASVRSESIAGPLVDQEIQSAYGVQVVKGKKDMNYFGKSAKITNATDLDMILYAADNMPESAKVIVAINADGPMVFSEFESKVDAILMGFSIENKAFLDIAAGKVEPSALLPIQMPKDMETVEKNFEDVPRDLDCYVDASGNTYDFAYGLNWSGVISDARTAKYNVPALVNPANTPN